MARAFSFRRWLAAAVLAAGLGVAPSAPSVALTNSSADTPEAAQATLDGWNAQLVGIDKAIDRESISDFDLRRLREQTSQIVNEATDFANSLTASVASAAAQAKELTPPQGGDAAISDAVKDSFDAAQKLYGDLSGSQKLAQAIAAHGAYTASQINDRRRQLFTQQLLERSASPLDPTLWTDAAAEVPLVTARASDLIGGWFRVLEDSNDRSAIALVLIVLASMLMLILPGRRMLIRRLRLRTNLVDRTPYKHPKVIAAAIVVALNVFVPVGVLIGGHAILNALDLSPDRIDQLWFGVISAVALFSLGFGTARALLAPGRPDLRLVDFDEPTALRVFRLAAAIAVMQGLAVFIVRFSKISYMGLPLIIAFDTVVSIATGILIILLVRTINRRRLEDEESDDSDEAEAGLVRIGLIAAGIAAGAAIIANLMGYVALGRFVTTQLTWIATVIALLSLLTMLADELTAAWFRREGMVGSRLIASVGFAPRSLTQVGVLFNGVVRVILIGFAVLLVIAPWGVDSLSIFESVRQLFFGFKIGSITISLSTIIAGITVFIIGVVITRALQGWLDTRFLPTTRLDSGLRNSIRTSVGHIGMIIAATIAFGYAGLDLSNIAIVAGALSVGIGLGLQSIVNNFVSGMILLAERPIRAGDWIAVGSEEGIVKRINVRATEIETFDRATVIVPNSSLISGVVKNMVLRDRSGRIVVSVLVAKTSDPEAVKAILLAIAKEHPLILAYPEPAVLFSNITAAALEFELRCYLSDIGQGAMVRSDIRFRAVAKFAEAEINLPS